MDIVARRFYAMTLAFLAVALAACYTATPLPVFDKFAHTVTDDTVVLYWDCSRPAPGVVRIAGVANNPYSPGPLKDVEFRLYGVNAQGANVSRARADAQDFLIYTNQASPFTIDYKTVGGEVRYDLVYSYLLSVPSGGFRESASGGVQQNFARNICAGLGP